MKTFACRTIPIAPNARSRSRWPSGYNGLQGQRVFWPVMLSAALQRNAKHEARLSNISGCGLHAAEKSYSEILRFAQNDNVGPGLTFDCLTLQPSKHLTCGLGK